jgi:hypothetical protein
LYLATSKVISFWFATVATPSFFTQLVNATPTRAANKKNFFIVLKKLVNKNC